MELLLNPKLTTLGRIGLKLHGSTFIGGYLRFQWLKKNIRKYFPSHGKLDFKILDAGSGAGSNAFMISNWFSKSTIYGCEYNQDVVSECNQISLQLGFKNLSFFPSDLRILSDQKKYDLIVCMDVLEHIPDNRTVLQNLISTLKPEGKIFIHVPYIEWLDHSIFSIENYKEYRLFEAKEHIGENFTIEDFKTQFARLGCSVDSINSTFRFFGRAGWELNQLAQEKFSPKLLPFIIPIAKLFCLIEVVFNFPIWTPGGIFVVATKKY